MRTIETYILPASWASYLVNADASGLDADDLRDCNAWLAENGEAAGAAVSCEDAGFFWQHDASALTKTGGECCYFHYITEVLNVYK